MTTPVLDDRKADAPSTRRSFRKRSATPKSKARSKADEQPKRSTKPKTGPSGNTSGPRKLETFDYVASDLRGQRVSGQLTAGSPKEAIDRLRRQQLRPIRLRAAKQSIFSREFSIPGVGDSVKPRELAAFTRQFATMVQAGIPLIRSLTVLGQQSDNPLMEKVLAQVRFDVEAGDSLSRSIARHPKVFDHLYCSMVAAGEESGALEEVLRQLAASQERSVVVRQKIRSAMSYPIAVLVMVSGVVAVMLRFVVPRFATIYDDLGGTLPLPTRLMVSASDVVVNRTLPLLLVIGLVVIGVRHWIGTDAGRFRWDSAKLRLPLIGTLIHKTVLARFGRTMAVLTAAGVPVLDTFAIASQTVGNAAVTAALERVREAIQRGEAIGITMLEEPIFPVTLVQLISVGEESGSLDQMFSIIGDTYEEEVAAAVDGFSSLIEPLLMALIGLVVGGMVISLYLPMFKIIDFVQ